MNFKKAFDIIFRFGILNPVITHDDPEDSTVLHADEAWFVRGGIEKSGLSFAKHTTQHVHIMKENHTNFITQLTGCFLLAAALLFLGHDARAQVVFADHATALLNNSGGQDVLAVVNSDPVGDEIVLDPGANNINAVVVPGVSTNVVLTSFEFEYYLDEVDHTAPTHSNPTGNPTWPAWTFDLKFYAMDGPLYGTNYHAPGTVIYDSGVQTEKGAAAAQPTLTSQNGFHTFTMNLASTKAVSPLAASSGGVLVPLDFTWTVAFGGAALEANNAVGLPVFATNTAAGLVGSAFPAYWENTGTNYTGPTLNGFAYTGTWVSQADALNVPMDFGADADASTAASILPTVKIVAPKNKFTDGTNRFLTVTGTATLKSKILNNHIAQVLWNLNGTNAWGTNGWNVVDSTVAVGTATNWTATVKLPVDGLGTAGIYGTTNIFAVEAIDAVDGTSVAATATYNFVSEQTATINVAGAGTVKYGAGMSASVFGSGNASGPIGPLIVGKKYTIAVTQTNDNPISYYFSDIGYSYVDSSGASQSGQTPTQFGSKSASTNYTFVMESNTVLTVNFVANKFIAAAGNYDGLFYNTNTGADLASAGYFTLTVNADKDRSFSGALYAGAGAVKTKFSGTFQLNGSTLNLALGANTNLTLTLPLSGANATVSGTIGGDITATLTGDKTSVSSASTFGGIYDLALPGAPGNGTNGPEGDATMALTLDSSKGTATLNEINFGPLKGAGVLKAKQIVPVVAANGEIPVFAQVNDSIPSGNPEATDGLVLGWLTIDRGTTDMASGSLTWVHSNPNNPGSVLDQLTGDFTYQANILASPYNASASPLITLHNQTVSGTGTATLALGADSASVTVTNTAGVGSAGFIYPATNYVTTGVAPHTHTAAIPTAYHFIITKPTTHDGSVSGTFTNAVIDTTSQTTENATYPWNGVLLQTHGQIRGSFEAVGGFGSVLIQ